MERKGLEERGWFTYEDTLSVVVGVAAHGAFAAARPDAEVTQVVGILLVIHGEAYAELPAPAPALLHHLRESLAPATLAIVFLELELLHLHHALDYVLLSFPPTALPVVQVLLDRNNASLYCSHRSGFLRFLRFIQARLLFSWNYYYHRLFTF
jgi:hypothetical protein